MLTPNPEADILPDVAYLAGVFYDCPLRSGKDHIRRVLWAFTSTSPRRFDGGDVNFLHRHHRLEGTLCLTATSRKRIR